MRPIGYFVHHQGRGHAERCAAIVNALPTGRPFRIFCARGDIFPPLRDGVEIEVLPSLFEPRGDEAPGLQALRTPPNMHCAPVGWPAISEAMAAMTAWFVEARPALMIVDVSAEVAQLARLCSVPVVKVLQHGRRSDAGHLSAYESAAGILAPYDVRLEQPDRPTWMRDMSFHAGGLGIGPAARTTPAAARRALGIEGLGRIALVISGGGGSGTPLAPLTMAARALPDWTIHVAGTCATEGHETVPGNLRLHGWIDGMETWLAAADLVIASTGNTTCHQILAAGKPWLAIPEWRYFEEQHEKARALEREGAAHVAWHWPGTPSGWAEAVEAALLCDTTKGRSMVDPEAAPKTARWLENLSDRLWAGAPVAAGRTPLHLAAE